MSQAVKRKLTTIFSADVSGYSRLMDADEVGTLETLRAHRDVVTGLIGRHHGRVVSWSGDGLLADFASCVEAVACAVEMQKELGLRNGDLPDERRMHFRIGINLGDVMVEGHDIFGEGVNIAARLQGLAPAGGVLISGSVYDQVRNKLAVGFDFLGKQTVKNIADEIPVYRVATEIAADSSASTPRRSNATASGPPRYAGLMRRGVAFLIDYSFASVLAFALAVSLELAIDDVIEIDMPLIDLSTERMVDDQVTESRAVENGIVTTTEKRFERTIFGLTKHTYRVKEERFIATAPAPDRTALPTPLAGQSTGAATGDGMADAAPPASELLSSSRAMIDSATGRPISPPDMFWLTILVYLAYLTLFESRKSGAALGKRAMAIRVTDEDGGRLNILRALGRNLSKIASVGTLGLGFVLPFLLKSKQTLHDRLADCVVIVAHERQGPAEKSVTPPGEVSQPSRP